VLGTLVERGISKELVGSRRAAFRSLLDPGVAVFQALSSIEGVVGSSRIMILWVEAGLMMSRGWLVT
jgi:hypothetical protein